MKDYYKLLFNEDEAICIASESKRSFVVPISDVIPDKRNVWVALNPMKPYTERKVKNVTAHRNILIEFDDMPLDEQLEFMKRRKIPYSAITYSGNKSYHFVIALTEDIGAETYDIYFRWLSAILDNKNDQSMSPSNTYTRVGGAVRNDDKTGNKDVLQEIKHIGSRISPFELHSLLSQFPALEPSVREVSEESARDSGEGEYELLKPYTRNFIETGESGNKIGRHFELKLSAIDMYEAGYDPDTAFEMLAPAYLERYEDKDEQEVRRLIEWVWTRL
jgi:hypothetical protein